VSPSIAFSGWVPGWPAAGLAPWVVAYLMLELAVVADRQAGHSHQLTLPDRWRSGRIIPACAIASVERGSRSRLRRVAFVRKPLSDSGVERRRAQDKMDFCQKIAVGSIRGECVVRVV
jgi:hypothetical protein